MRKQLAKTVLTAALGLALAFTFGCDDKDSPASPPAVLPPPSAVAPKPAAPKAAVPKIVPCPNAATGAAFVSCGGQVYKTVKIGKQVWMAENLNYDVPSTATDICYEYKKENCAKYGRLYNWATAMALPPKCNSISSKDDADCAVKSPTHQGICPNGWHIPRSERLDVIFGDKSKLKAKSGWNSYDSCLSGGGPEPGCTEVMRSGNGTDNYGFAALPGGHRSNYGEEFRFNGIGGYGKWWSASETYAGAAQTKAINSDNEAEEGEGESAKGDLLSIRCLKD